MRNGSTEKTIRILALLYLLVLSSFGLGVVVRNFEIFPYPQLKEIYDELNIYFTFSDGAPHHNSIQDKLILDHQESRIHYPFSGFTLRDPGFHDTGCLLISRYSKDHGQVIVELFSIATNRILHTWIPPLSDIFRLSPDFNSGTNMRESYRAQHPLLLKDGSLIFTSGEGPMVRINACSEVVWIISRHFHHSIEMDFQGNIVSPIVLEEQPSQTIVPIRNDGIAVVSPDGEILNEYSFVDILLENSYRTLIYGIGQIEKDRIHLNDVQPISRHTQNTEMGDLALSSRNLSTVALFRPRTGKIIWLKTGPWLAQHDINQLDDGRYSIFGNDVVRQGNSKPIFMEKKKSDIYIFDALSDTVIQPYSAMMRKAKIATETSGRLKILANGDAYIEQSDYNRLLRISPDTIRWEYVNSASPYTTGAVHWSRYFSKEEISLAWKENAQCN